jgi:enediyne biosynthesis protein E4
MRRLLLIVTIGLALTAIGWFAVMAVAERDLRGQLRAAQAEIGARRIHTARAQLYRLAQRWPGRSEVAYWMGMCEMISHHDDDALDFWGRVPLTAPDGALAALARGRLAIELGRYRLAETSLEGAVAAGGDIGAEARKLLGRVYWMTARRERYRSFLLEDAERTEDASQILRTFWSLDDEAFQVEAVAQVLGKAKKSAPDDDRVWLALADLETRVGHFDEASDWLTRCERASPDDSDVWNVRLRWAKAADRPDELMRAAAHIPAAGIPRSKLLSLGACLAASAGDRKAERMALEELASIEPADVASIERLTDIAAQDADKDRVAKLRRQKLDVETALEHYKQLVIQQDQGSLAVELARAAEPIGRRYDAKMWWRIATQRDPALGGEAALARARLTKAEPPVLRANASLADVLRDSGFARVSTREAVAKLDAPTFVDEAQERGLSFIFDNGRSPLRQLPETMSGGVALLDFDSDGWLDIYAVQGGKFPPPPTAAPFGDRLFHNRGDGRFEDATTSSGLAALPGGYGHGVAVGDYDNDGRPDVFVTRWRSYALYHNLGGGRFEDATAAAGLGGDRDWPTSAAWGDLDDDGDLDLYVCHYIKWNELHPATCTVLEKPDAGYNYCGPRAFPAQPDHVFRNDHGRFVDVTADAGLVDREGRGLGVVTADLDGDGRLDLFVANDTTPNYFLRNQGGFRLSEEGAMSGLAASASGGYLAGMGVAFADFDGDGRLDLAVTNFIDESTTLYHNHGNGIFSDRSAESGLAAPTRLVIGFGLAALDANSDGWPDLAQANGHVADYRPTFPYQMPAHFFLNAGQGKLRDVSDQAGPFWKVPRLGRGLAVGDIDNDGRIDVIIVSENEPLALLHNQSTAQNHFFVVALEGASSNRDAVGATVAVTAAGKTHVAARFGGGSYLSASDTRLHFGLGTARVADRVEITWPSGRRDSHQGLAADTGYILREGDPAPRPLAGFSRNGNRR